MKGLPFPPELVLEPVSKQPTLLAAETLSRLSSTPVPSRRTAPRTPPTASVVVAVHNGLEFTRLCLGSLLADRFAPPLEVIVVDNGSTDGTGRYLAAMSAADPRLVPFASERNLGFAGGVNAGLGLARAPHLVLLNNDTVLPPGWLRRLLPHLADPAVGLVGARANQAPDVANAGLSYRTYGEFLLAAETAGRRRPAGLDVQRLTLFCAALRRDVLERVGPLDERFEVGMFEDDDLCLRIASAGFRIRLADDVLVHHFGGASLGKLVSDGRWRAIFEANRRRFEEKWGEQWRGHVKTDSPDYSRLIQRWWLLVGALPIGARVLVVSRGDDRLLDILGRVGGHFPQTPGGAYAGSYPADSEDAVGQLVRLAESGWTHVAFPNPSRWWLDHYRGLASHLEGRICVDDPRTAVVFEL